MKEKTWEAFFDEHADYNVATYFYESSGSFTMEELYQAIKARLLAELLVDVHGTSNYGRLVERSDAAPHTSSTTKEQP